jgi:hypothetical protein
MTIRRLVRYIHILIVLKKIFTSRLVANFISVLVLFFGVRRGTEKSDNNVSPNETSLRSGNSKVGTSLSKQ